MKHHESFETIGSADTQEREEEKPSDGGLLKEKVLSEIESGVNLLDRTVDNIQDKAKNFIHWDKLGEQERGRIKDVLMALSGTLVAASMLEAFNTNIIQQALGLASYDGAAKLIGAGELVVALSRGAKGLIHGLMALNGRPKSSENLSEEEMDHLSIISLFDEAPKSTMEEKADN